MKDLLQFLKDMHFCTCNLLLVPVVSLFKGISLEDAYWQWYNKYIIDKFL